MIILWILIPLIVVLPIFSLLVGLKRGQTPHQTRRQREKAEYLGAIGEEQVETLLRRCMIEGDKLLSNVRLPNWEEGDIDHILLSTRGFFVIETKNWAGDIYGDETSEQWKLVFSDGTTEKRFSPFKQNNGHIYALKQFCNLRVWFENIIVFVQDNTQYIQSSCVFTMAEFEQRLNSLHDVNIRNVKERDNLFALLGSYATRVFELPKSK